MARGTAHRRCGWRARRARSRRGALLREQPRSTAGLRRPRDDPREPDDPQPGSAVAAASDAARPDGHRKAGLQLLACPRLRVRRAAARGVPRREHPDPRPGRIDLLRCRTPHASAGPAAQPVREARNAARRRLCAGLGRAPAAHPGRELHQPALRIADGALRPPHALLRDPWLAIARGPRRGRAPPSSRPCWERAPRRPQRCCRFSCSPTTPRSSTARCGRPCAPPAGSTWACCWRPR